MKLHVQMKFSSAEREEIVSFASRIGMGVDEFCKRAVFYAINDAYKKAEAIQNDNTTTGINSTDTSPGLLGNGDTNSPTLSNQTDESTNS